MGTGASQDRSSWLRGVLARFESPLTLYAAGLVGDVHRARDVVQETFLRLCREDRAKVESRVGPWLYAVTRSRAVDERRREQAARRARAGAANGLAKHEPDPPSAAETRDAASRALRALDGLPEGQQEALRLKFQHGFSYAQIADVMSTTTGNVAVLVHRGLAAMRTALRDRTFVPASTQPGGVR
jgi:RNA polymerase sigma-70 factor (ECF subfamily)